VTLSVDVQSNEYASVIFTVWESGADRENDQPIKKINASAIDGKAEGTWRIDLSDTGIELSESSRRNSPGMYPVTSISGMKSRLKDLRYYSGYTDNSTDQASTNAVMRFQSDKGLDDTGLPDKATQDKIKEVHDREVRDRQTGNETSSDETPPDEAKLIFTADSFLCDQAVSGDLTVGLNYLEIELVDHDGNTMSNAPYEVVLPSGKKKTGWLNDEGYARVLVTNPEECQVIFPELEEGSWEKE
jgi:hypothetical protein